MKMISLWFAAFGLVFASAIFIGCGEKKNAENPLADEAAAPAENLSAADVLSEIGSLSDAELATLGPRGDLPTEWIFPNAVSANILRPSRFGQFSGAAEISRFFEYNPGLLPNWAAFRDLDLVLMSHSLSLVPLTDPATGETRGERYPLSAQAIYLKKSVPFDKAQLTMFAFGPQSADKVKETTLAGLTVQTLEQPIQVPLDQTGKNTATIKDALFALYTPDETTAIIVNGSREDVERFFTAGDGDHRGRLAQRLGRASISDTDFAFAFDFESPLKQTIQIPVNQELGEALFQKARFLLLTIDSAATGEQNAAAVQVAAATADDAAAIESAFGSSLMQLAQQVKVPEELPAGMNVPEQLLKYREQLGVLIKTITMEKAGEVVTVCLKGSPELATLAVEATKFFNDSADDAAQGARVEQVGQALAFLGRLLNNLYYGKNNAFPPTAIRSADGVPLLSWRVAVLPALGPDGEALYKQFKLDEPWNSETNLKLLDKMPPFFRSPLDPSLTNKTTYQIFNSPETPFGRTAEPQKIQDFPNPGRTFMVVSTAPAKAIEWTRPDELAFEPEKFGEIFGNFVLAVPVIGEVFGAPFTGTPNEVKAVSDWILGNISDTEGGADAPDAPAETPAEVPAPAEPAVAAPAVAEQPAAAEVPAPAEPAVAEPAVAEPAVAEPAVAEPAVAEPAVAEQPAAAEPAPAEPETK